MTTKSSDDFPQFHQINHPLIQHKLTLLRDKHTSMKVFKELVHEITLLLVYEATRDIPLQTITIDTPLETLEAPTLAGKDPVILPILRAGIGMVDAFLSLMPTACVGHIGLYRDEKTLHPHRYYFKIPKDHQQRIFFMCDPMVATGGSAIETINELKQEHVENIIFVCLVAAPEGLHNLYQAHPDVPIYGASLDRQLNDHGYILPGLGDAGDRLFGTL